MEQIYTPKQVYKVLVRCFTYNQSKYIKDALNGFSMQKTNFPFVCLVMDDCSTDGEQEAIMGWMERECNMEKAENIDLELSNVFIVPHKSNENCTFAFYLLKQNLYGRKERKMKHVTPWRICCEYEATCEGDDYWIAPNKLQKQADYLDCHPETMLCFHSVQEIYEGRPNLNKIRKIVDNRDYTGLEFYREKPSQFASFMLRINILNSELYEKVKRNKKFIAGDIPLLLTCAHYGSLRGMQEVMSVYRRCASGWTESIKNEEQYWKIINSHNEYVIFGEEFYSEIKKKYIQDCCSIFLRILCVKHIVKVSFFWAAFRKSPFYCLYYMLSIIITKLIRK